MLITRGLSMTNFAVASTALAFQVFVLYPWHSQLSDDFEALKKEHLRVLQTVKDDKSSPSGAGEREKLREQMERHQKDFAGNKQQPFMDSMMGPLKRIWASPSQSSESPSQSPSANRD